MVDPMELELSGNNEFAMDVCPKLFHLEWEKGAELIGKAKRRREVSDLKYNSIEWLLEGKSVSEAVNEAVRRTLVTITPREVLEIKKILDEWLGKSECDIREGKNRIRSEYENEEIKIVVKVPVVECENNELHIWLIKTDGKLYTFEGMKDSYEPIVYGFIINQNYQADNVVVHYEMVDHGHSIYMEFGRRELNKLWELFKMNLANLMKERERTVLGGHCSYCRRKGICNEYKVFLLEVMGKEMMVDLRVMKMSDLVEYVVGINKKHSILKERRKEVYDLLIHEMLNNGDDELEIGDYRLKLVRKTEGDLSMSRPYIRIYYQGNKILDGIKSKEYVSDYINL